jgi:hypothetical protein
MKKIKIITLVLGLFLFSCKNNNTQQDTKTGKSETTVSQPTADCTSYSIFNPRGPSGATVLYTYVDCNGKEQSGSVDPQQTVYVLAQPGTVKCPGGVVTESGAAKKGTKPTSQLSQQDADCLTYSIFNPRGPTGATVLFTYVDCSGGQKDGSVDPQQTVTILAQRGTVKCPGGVVTEGGGPSRKSDVPQTKP